MLIIGQKRRGVRKEWNTSTTNKSTTKDDMYSRIISLYSNFELYYT